MSDKQPTEADREEAQAIIKAEKDDQGFTVESLAQRVFRIRSDDVKAERERLKATIEPGLDTIEKYIEDGSPLPLEGHPYWTVCLALGDIRSILSDGRKPPSTPKPNDEPFVTNDIAQRIDAYASRLAQDEDQPSTLSQKSPRGVACLILNKIDEIPLSLGAYKKRIDAVEAIIADWVEASGYTKPAKVSKDVAPVSLDIDYLRTEHMKAIALTFGEKIRSRGLEHIAHLHAEKDTPCNTCSALDRFSARCKEFNRD